jgi:hypothetical protein
MAVHKITLAFCLICFVHSGLLAQQAVPPPPKPADDGPGLEVTMKFIQDKLNDIGPLRWTVTSRNADTGEDLTAVWTAEFVKVVADPQRCTISYHSFMSVGAVGPSGQQPPPPRKQPADGVTLVLNVKEVKKITVKSEEEALKETAGWENAGNVRPPIFVITVQQSRNRRHDFYVDDEELANRLARAITHSVELCTPDKNPEPF